MWVSTTAFLPTPPRAPLGPLHRPWLLAPLPNLCWQDSRLQDGPRAALRGCFLTLAPGRVQALPSAQVPGVPGWPPARRGPGLCLGTGMLAPWWQRWRMRRPRPGNSEKLFRLRLPESIIPPPSTKCQFRARHCSRPLRFRGEQGCLGSGLVGKTDHKLTQGAVAILGVIRATFPSKERTSLRLASQTPASQPSSAAVRAGQDAAPPACVTFSSRKPKVGGSVREGQY